MKGFPNQVTDLVKLGRGMLCLSSLITHGQSARDEMIFGEALVRAHVAGTGHIPLPVEEYLAAQRQKPPENQSIRATARGLRQLFALLGFIRDDGHTIRITPNGDRVAGFGSPLQADQVSFWRQAILNMTHADSDGEISHPYQVLLRLVSRKPGISRAKCALALEAKNDSQEELDRIVELSEKSEAAIKMALGVSKSNWDNAKKVLPKFAEQLGDVVIVGSGYVLADAPGRASEGSADTLSTVNDSEARSTTTVRAPRNSRAVTPETIGRAGTSTESSGNEDQAERSPPANPAETARLRADRLRRHNQLVQELAKRLQDAGARLFEDPFDILALIEQSGVLAEVKTLDGTAPDEVDRVREAFSQILYYESFVTRPVSGDAAIIRVACFESPISAPHRAWLNSHRIGSIWKSGSVFVGDELAVTSLGHYIEELTRSA